MLNLLSQLASEQAKKLRASGTIAPEDDIVLVVDFGDKHEHIARGRITYVRDAAAVILNPRVIPGKADELENPYAADQHEASAINADAELYINPSRVVLACWAKDARYIS